MPSFPRDKGGCCPDETGSDEAAKAREVSSGEKRKELANGGRISPGRGAPQEVGELLERGEKHASGADVGLCVARRLRLTPIDISNEMQCRPLGQQSVEVPCATSELVNNNYCDIHRIDSYYVMRYTGSCEPI